MAEDAEKPKKKLSIKQIKALNMMGAGATIQEAADALGINRGTISDWKQPGTAFSEKLETMRSEAEEDLKHSVPMTTSFMLKQLKQLALDGPPETRLKAVQFYLTWVSPKLETQHSVTGNEAADRLIAEMIRNRAPGSRLAKNHN